MFKPNRILTLALALILALSSLLALAEEPTTVTQDGVEYRVEKDSMGEMLVPTDRYENAAATAKLAFKENISLKEACIKLGFMTEEEFDEVFHPEEMAGTK